MAVLPPWLHQLRTTRLPPPAPHTPRRAIAQGSSEFNITALIDAKNSGAQHMLCPIFCMGTLASGRLGLWQKRDPGANHSRVIGCCGTHTCCAAAPAAPRLPRCHRRNRSAAHAQGAGGALVMPHPCTSPTDSPPPPPPPPAPSRPHPSCSQGAARGARPLLPGRPAHRHRPDRPRPHRRHAAAPAAGAGGGGLVEVGVGAGLEEGSRKAAAALGMGSLHAGWSLN